jgi:hypothetical protein
MALAGDGGGICLSFRQCLTTNDPKSGEQHRKMGYPTCIRVVRKERRLAFRLINQFDSNSAVIHIVTAGTSKPFL